MIDESVRDVAVDLLEAAAARIDKHGWVANGTGTERLSDNPPLCIMNSLFCVNTMFTEQSVALSITDRNNAWALAFAGISQVTGFPMQSIGYWNDHECKGGAEAAEVLHKAAKFVDGLVE